METKMLGKSDKKLILKEEFDSLFSDSISKKQYDLIIEKIDKRFKEICLKFLIIEKRGWFDYDNGDYESEKTGGYFDPKEYKENIGIMGEWIDGRPGWDLEFPTRWLWENFEKEMKDVEKKFKLKQLEIEKKNKNKKEKEKARFEELKSSVKSKLTSEELKIINFVQK